VGSDEKRSRISEIFYLAQIDDGTSFCRAPEIRRTAILVYVMMSVLPQSEKICWVWSDRREREISVRVRFSMAEDNGCQIYSITGRDEWVI
jgi:hypothetical protein